MNTNVHKKIKHPVSAEHGCRKIQTYLFNIILQRAQALYMYIDLKQDPCMLWILKFVFYYVFYFCSCYLHFHLFLNTEQLLFKTIVGALAQEKLPSVSVLCS